MLPRQFIHYLLGLYAYAMNAITQWGVVFWEKDHFIIGGSYLWLLGTQNHSVRLKQNARIDASQLHHAIPLRPRGFLLVYHSNHSVKMHLC